MKALMNTTKVRKTVCWKIDLIAKSSKNTGHESFFDVDNIDGYFAPVLSGS